ncbi:MAG: alpha-glucosidase [Lachnospiraceae bacterium]|nr:alpha-glucosidase [Lachnospiraceae bacterium]
MKELLEDLELVLGVGEDHFTMKRGSFKYKTKLSRTVKLERMGTFETKEGSRIDFKGPLTGELFSLNIEKEDRRMKVSFSGEGAKFNRFIVSFKASPKERIYGCGETYSKFNLKGEKVRIWVAEHQNTNRIGRKILKEKITGKHPEKTLKFEKYESYYAQPTFVSSLKYYVHCDVKTYSEFDFRDPNRITLKFEEPPVFYIGYADTFEEISEELLKLLGRTVSLPEWIYEGAILAIQGGCDIIDEKIKKAKEHNVKISGIWSQDWCGCRKTGFGYQVMWNWQWDRELYPNLDSKISKWNSEGIKFLGYINPFIALEKNLYKIASEKGYCVKDKEGKDYLVKITTFPAAMVDFTNPDAYEWYKNLIKENMIGLGMGGWMADFGEYLPVDCVLYSGEDPSKLHNEWPAIWAKLNREAIEECNKLGEVFFFTRAGFTGTVNNSLMMWTGDQHVDWSVDDGLPSVIPATLSLAMSGYPIAHSDVGGYTTIMHMRRSKELLMRWEEMNVFSPLFRSHEGNQPVNDVQFDDDEELLKQLEITSHMHANLKYYLIHLVDEANSRGIPVMRPVFYHYDEDWAYDEMSEYLLGSDVLVAPIIKEGAVGRNVHLPDDEWVHLFSKREYRGGEYYIDAPIGEPPVFIRKNSSYFENLIGVADLYSLC